MTPASLVVILDVFVNGNSSEVFLHGVDRAPASKVADFLILCARVERHYGARYAVSVAAEPPPTKPISAFKETRGSLVFCASPKQSKAEHSTW